MIHLCSMHMFCPGQHIIHVLLLLLQVLAILCTISLNNLYYHPEEKLMLQTCDCNIEQQKTKIH